MGKVKLYGKEYPMYVTMGAMRRFKKETGSEVSQMGNDIVNITTFMWCCVASACNAENIPFQIDADKFADGISMDDFVQFQKAFEENTSGDDAKKKNPSKSK